MLLIFNVFLIVGRSINVCRAPADYRRFVDAVWLPHFAMVVLVGCYARCDGVVLVQIDHFLPHAIVPFFCRIL